MAVFSYVYKYRNMIFRIGEQFTSYSDIESKINTYSKQHYVDFYKILTIKTFVCLSYRLLTISTSMFSVSQAYTPFIYEST